MPIQDQCFTLSRWVLPEGAKAAATGNQSARFYLSFQLPDALPALQFDLHITANSRYKLYINETLVGVGPRKGNAFQHFYESITDASLLRPGENRIEVWVLAYAPLSNPDNMGLSPISVLSNGLPPALLCAGQIKGEGVEVCLNTGTAPYKAANETALSWIRHPQTHYVGAFERWEMEKKSPLLPDEMPDVVPAWDPMTNDYGEMPAMLLHKRTIAQMYIRPMAFARQMNRASENVLEGGAVIAPNTSWALELDAGVLTTGYMQLAFLGGRGALVRVRYAECYRYTDAQGRKQKGVRDEPCENGLEDAYDELILCGGAASFEPFWLRCFRFVRMEVQTGDEALQLAAPRYLRTAYPLDARAAAASASAPWVEKLFEVSLRTLENCMHETYEDCPFFEQLQYISDTKLEMDFTYAVANERALPRQAIEDYYRSLMPDGMLQSRTPSQHKQAIPQFALYWIHMLVNLHQQEGDAALVRRYAPGIDAVLAYFDRHLDEDGLVRDLGYWDFADWEPRWEKGVPQAITQAKGPSTVHNLCYAWTLDEAAKLMDLIGRSSTANEYRQRGASIKRAVQRLCYVQEDGLYKDGPDFAGHSQHAQVFATLAGLLQKDEAARALLRTMQDENAIKCSYPQQFYLLRAMEQAGIYDQCIMEIFAPFVELLKLNITTLPETPFEPRSDCHAWSALLLYELPRVWLGVKPAAAGWNGILVAPRAVPGILDLRGVVPTPHGDVRVAYETTGGQVRFYVQAPGGCATVIQLQDGKRVVLEGGGVYDWALDLP